MLIAVDEESLINSDIANRRKRIMDGQLIDKLGRRIEQQQAEINRLGEALQSIKQQTINLEDYEEIGAIATISDICDKTLNSEKEEK